MAEHIVVGGGIAATQAAETIRRLNEADSITLIAEEERPFYLRPLLVDFVAGRVQEERIWRDFEAVAAANAIKLVTGRRAAGIDRVQRAVVLQDGTKLRYDRLLVATGVKPRLPEIPGVGLDRVVAFSSYVDALQMVRWVGDARRAVVIGRGLQGVEVTRALRLREVAVTMIVPDESPWFPARFQVKGEMVEQALRERGVEVIALDQATELVEEEGRVAAVRTRGGREIAADIVAFALDQRACTEFLVGSGISLADGVVVDGQLRSSDENVYAAGDVAQMEVGGKRRPLGYGWLRAMRQGETAGRNMAGERVTIEAGDEAEAHALYGLSLLARWG